MPFSVPNKQHTHTHIENIISYENIYVSKCIKKALKGDPPN